MGVFSLSDYFALSALGCGNNTLSLGRCPRLSHYAPLALQNQSSLTVGLLPRSPRYASTAHCSHCNNFFRALFFPSELQLIEPRIEAAALEQFFMRSALNNLAFIDHENHVGAADGCQAVSNDDR